MATLLPPQAGQVMEHTRWMDCASWMCFLWETWLSHVALAAMLTFFYFYNCHEFWAACLTNFNTLSSLWYWKGINMSTKGNTFIKTNFELQLLWSVLMFEPEVIRHWRDSMEHMEGKTLNIVPLRRLTTMSRSTLLTGQITPHGKKFTLLIWDH